MRIILLALLAFPGIARAGTLYIQTPVTLPNVAITTAPNSFNSNSTNTFSAPTTFVGSVTTSGQVLLNGPTNTFTYGLATSTINATGQIFAGSFAATALSAIGTNSSDINTLNGNVTLSPGGVVALTGLQAGKNISVTYGISAGTITATSGLTVTTGTTLSGAAFVGVAVSSQTRGAAGASVTATCYTQGTFAIGGGCDCTVEVAETSKLSVPNCQTQGCVPTGWTCQSVGGTGGQCVAYAICSRLQ